MSEHGLRQQDYETIKALKQELADIRARLEKAEPIVAAARRAEKNTEPVKQINPTDWAAWGMIPPEECSPPDDAIVQQY